jgi:hypothetical protein
VAGHGHQPQYLHYRRRAKARHEAALAQATAAREALLDRLQWQLAELRASLDKIAVANAAMATELALTQAGFCLNFP